MTEYRYDWIQVTNTILSYIYTWTRTLPRTTVTKHCHLRGSAGHMHAYFSTKPCTHRLTNNRNSVTRNSSHTGNVSIKRCQSTLMARVRWSWHWPGQPNRSLMRMISFLMKNCSKIIGSIAIYQQLESRTNMTWPLHIYEEGSEASVTRT